MLTQKKLKEFLKYNRETGMFTWLMSRGAVKFGAIAGHKRSDGYIHIRINGKLYLAHRLAWLFSHGCCPKEIDHINHETGDNRIINLRKTDHHGNSKNQSLFKNNTSGVCGVSWDTNSNKWKSQININGKRKHLGLSIDKFEAICSRLSANNKYGFHTNHGLKEKG